jgi:hypothetical protein
MSGVAQQTEIREMEDRRGLSLCICRDLIFRILLPSIIFVVILLVTASIAMAIEDET